MKHPIPTLVILGLLSIGLAGCSSVRNLPEHKTEETYPFIRLSPSAPPKNIYEPIPQSQYPMTEVWRKGFWQYDGREFTWVEGHYMISPDPTATWIPDRWEQRTFGWSFIPGYWQ